MKRWAVLASLAVALTSCTPGPPVAAPATAPAPAPSAGATAPGNLAAAEPAPPSLAAFRREAERACATAVAKIDAAPLRGDPLSGDPPADAVAAAVEHYRQAAAAWSAAAGQLWEFGLPRRKAGQNLITALDTVGQYSKQTADYLQAGSTPEAQAVLGAVDVAKRQADRIAASIGIGPLEDCGSKPRVLANARREPVTAADFTFGVGAVRPGRTRFVVRNDGDELHQLFVVRLREQGTTGAAVREDRDGGNPGRYLANKGAATPVIVPGEQGSVDVKLRTGPYALLCFVASKDGTPHAYKGMATEIFVSP